MGGVVDVVSLVHDDHLVKNFQEKIVGNLLNVTWGYNFTILVNHPEALELFKLVLELHLAGEIVSEEVMVDLVHRAEGSNVSWHEAVSAC